MIALAKSFHTARTAGWRCTCWVALLWLFPASHGAQAADPFFFIQLTDPQFGMCASDADFQQETANFEFAIATANRLRPAFVIVTGDLINKTGDPAQTAEYKRIVAKLDPAIPLYSLAGNHDVGNEPTPETIAAYRTEFGPDYFAFRRGALLGIVLNSTLIRAADGAPQEADAQQKWLQTELEKRRESYEIRHVIVFQHHPWFVERVDEPDAYNNLPLQKRIPWLNLFRQAGVTHVFAGHTHANSVTQFESLEMVVSCAIGKPLQKDGSGLRLVIVRDSGITHRYYHLGEIPNQIDLATAPAQDR
jgi:3',5'-cyclic AMP phosphodiesterase CpdA